MNKLILSVVLSIVLMACQNSTHNKQADSIGQKVEKLLSQMTLEEKIGQMWQVNGGYGHDDNIRQGKIGSILNDVDPQNINRLQKIALEESRLGIPLIIARDVIHGFKTVFPIPLGQAASWNPELVEQGCRIAAQEASSTGIRWTFAPMIDISRDARWGRIAESCGEDPYLTSVLGAAMVKGFQGDSLNSETSIIACAKHMAGYGAAEGGRDYNTTLIPPRELRDVYLPPFKAAVDAGVRTFMAAFNDIDGVPATGNEFLFRQVLRNEWHFDGFVVSDWASPWEMINHGFVADEKEAALRAIKAGVNMEMATSTYNDNIKVLIEEGLLDIKIIDQAVRDVLRVKFEMGLFDNPYVAEENQYQFAKPKYLEAAKLAATQSMVLLKNDKNTLPLSLSKKIALIGPMANQAYEQLGTWIFDGDSTLTVTPLKGLQDVFGKDKVMFAEGMAISRTRHQKGYRKAIEQAKKSDVIVFVGGEESILSGEAHSRANIDLPGVQNDLIKELKKTGKPLVLVVMAGRPLTIGAISEYADAVIYAWHPGTMGGAALADIIAGNANPSGKLPVTFPKEVGQIPMHYNHKNTGRPANLDTWTQMYDIPVKAPQTSLGNESHYIDAGFEPLYPFGYGLSYTSFVYSDISLDKEIYAKDDIIAASIKVKNTGEMAGDEIVQLYVRDLVGNVSRPVKELKAFKRISLNEGEETTLTLTLDVNDLAFTNVAMERVVEPGQFELWIGGDSNATLSTFFSVK
ncbi:beta-glucosidase BglX [Carboxylicivirga sp. A043]|uniref:beta-glucosidase BglX n=1 Tax=Carboxylicivirga litoralis TaxID=2816963 RepID=UPI0021CB512B|nr:beta-glucosidase BglX [Carboxylicivirga sp. A043]MCU4156442.1 beta-glucosidase BglX [Carboxylicivirga sp. A043]